ncbi:MAG: hypothetical protein ACI4R8_02270 [Candidatus Caccovivens sp.]
MMDKDATFYIDKEYDEESKMTLYKLVDKESNMVFLDKLVGVNYDKDYNLYVIDDEIQNDLIIMNNEGKVLAADDAFNSEKRETLLQEAAVKDIARRVNLICSHEYPVEFLIQKTKKSVKHMKNFIKKI